MTAKTPPPKFDINELAYQREIRRLEKENIELKRLTQWQNEQCRRWSQLFAEATEED